MQPVRLAPRTSTTGTAETRVRERRDPTSWAFMVLSLGGDAGEHVSRGSAPSMPPARRMYDRRLQNVVPARLRDATGSAKGDGICRRCARRLQLQLKLRARRAGRAEQRAGQLRRCEARSRPRRRVATLKRVRSSSAYAPVPRMRVPKLGSLSRPPRASRTSDIT